VEELKKLERVKVEIQVIERVKCFTLIHICLGRNLMSNTANKNETNINTKLRHDDVVDAIATSRRFCIVTVVSKFLSKASWTFSSFLVSSFKSIESMRVTSFVEYKRSNQTYFHSSPVVVSSYFPLHLKCPPLNHLGGSSRI